MFRITEDPSPGSLVHCLAKNYKSDVRVNSVRKHNYNCMLDDGIY